MTRLKGEREDGREVIRLLTELDALQDTRLGLMDVLDPEAAVRLIRNPAYYRRQVDNFEELCGFPHTRYQEAWKARDKQALQHALHTPATDLIHYGLLMAERGAMADPTLAGAALDVNTYPYVLDEDEQREYARAIAEIAGFQAQIRLIHEPTSTFTVDYCRANYAGLILYNHTEWFRTHHEELFRHGMPRVTMVAPKLWPERPLSSQELTVDGLGEVDPWYQAVLPMLQYVGLEYVDVRHFCIAHPRTPV